MSSPSLRTFSYQYPYFTPFTTGLQEQWVQVTASNASVNTQFSSKGNSSIIFPFASSHQFFKTDQMLMMFDASLLDANGALVTGAAATISAQGISRAFSQILIRIGSFVVESLHYDEQVGQFYSNSGVRKGKYLTLMEGYGTPTVFSATGKASFAMRIMSSLFYSGSALPLPCIQGLTVELMLAPIENLAVGATVAELRINNPYIRTLAISPDQSYTLSLQSSIARGGSLWLPLIESRQTLSNGYQTDRTDVTVPLGVYSSIDSISVTMWSSSGYQNRANDRYQRYNYNGLTGWSVKIGDLVNPQTRHFVCGPGDQCLETLLVTLMSSAGSLDNLEDFAELTGTDRATMFTNYLTQWFRFGLNGTSANEAWGSGWNLEHVASTNAVVHLQFANAITPDVTIMVTVTASVLLEINNQMPVIWRTFPQPA